MTTAHRPTFDPARGKEAQRGPAYHQRLLPAHTELKVRQPGQGGSADAPRDLRAELLKAEAAYAAKKKGLAPPSTEPESAISSETPHSLKRSIEAGSAALDNPGEEEDETPEAKRRRVLEATRELDADSDGGDDNSEEDDDSSSEESDDEDETATLMRELEKIKRERAAAKAAEEASKAAEDEAAREVDIARGNPLLNDRDETVKRRWDEDVVFRNQARGTEDKRKKEFVNDLLRSDFHKRFMSKYVR